MSRRPLRKIDPSLDLSRHLVALDDLPRPWNAVSLFGRDAPLEVEVGSGKGLFLTQAAAEFPERDFLGIEVAARYARFCAAKLVKAGLSNARMIEGDAQRIFAEFLPDKSVAAVHLYFPDPWWKARHKKRRVMNERFLRDVERVLVPGGELHFWTDVEEYFTEALAQIAGSTTLQGPIAVSEHAPQHDLDFRTHFERRTRLHSEAVYRSRFVKTSGTTAGVASIELI
jgi:tRNA (guanine-N7-)-methyltransferase